MWVWVWVSVSLTERASDRVCACVSVGGKGAPEASPSLAPQPPQSLAQGAQGPGGCPRLAALRSGVRKKALVSRQAGECRESVLGAEEPCAKADMLTRV